MANAAARILAQLAGRERAMSPVPGAIWHGCQCRVVDGLSSGVSHLA